MIEHYKFEKYKQCSCGRYVLFDLEYDPNTGISKTTCPKCGVEKVKVHDYAKFENGKLVEYRDNGKVIIY